MDGELPSTLLFMPNKRNVLILWPQIEKWLAPLLKDEGCYAPEDILLYHLEGKMQIWAGCEGPKVEIVIVSQILEYPLGKVCSFPYAAGENLVKWVPHYLRECEGFARASGCIRSKGGFRKGWVRVLGYREVGCLLVKELA